MVWVFYFFLSEGFEGANSQPENLCHKKWSETI